MWAPTLTARDHALTASAGQLGLTAESASAGVWLAAVEIGGSQSVVTLIALADGTTCLYFDGQGGTIRPDEATDVAKATRHLLAIAARSMDALAPVRAGVPQPRQGRVTFLVRTAQGAFGAESDATDLAAGRARLSSLYDAAMAVFAVIRG